MKIIYLIIILIILIFYIINKEEFKLFKLWFTNIENNFNQVSYKKRKILIITAENRNDEYIKYHDINFNNYCKKNNYDYIRMDNCPKEESTTYWCKIHKVKNALENNNYDYIMWADSDTIIVNDNILIDDFISEYGEPDIIIGNDEKIINILPINILCAGVFLIKNSEIGKSFINDCLLELNKLPECIINNKEQGIWAGICYEQGIINLLLKTKYKNFVYLDKEKKFIYNKYSNKNINYKNNFIVHLAGHNNNSRKNQFKKYI